MENWKRIQVIETEDHIPDAVEWDGEQFKIDAVIGSRRDVVHKMGKIGMIYQVLIHKQRRVLFRDSQQAWYISKPDQHAAVGGRRIIHCCADLRDEMSRQK